ncbi:hypothetical protein C9427_19390 [Mesorhizobium helmanticense]|uniref:Uncharacterized protein n=1 Tax=Mesorhizobium helmanticense TaxID=1776423 RepID=A0A2T4IT28_9HYPH|nr:hypothetical protein C9427_19390 [Mesorhizobium helmanticense]
MAVYTAHGEKCYICTRPVDFQSMQVDHIIPETLLDNADVLAKVLKIFNLPESFKIDSYENWMPCCGPCNNKKKARVFGPTPLIQAPAAMRR